MKPFECPHCEKSFSADYSLKSHLQTHEKRPSSKNVGPRKKKLPRCNKCKKDFNCYRDVMEHLKNGHLANEGRVVCFVCKMEMPKGEFKYFSRYVFNYFYYLRSLPASHGKLSPIRGKFRLQNM